MIIYWLKKGNKGREKGISDHVLQTKCVILFNKDFHLSPGWQQAGQTAESEQMSSQMIKSCLFMLSALSFPLQCSLTVVCTKLGLGLALVSKCESVCFFTGQLNIQHLFR